MRRSVNRSVKEITASAREQRVVVEQRMQACNSIKFPCGIVIHEIHPSAPNINIKYLIFASQPLFVCISIPPIMNIRLMSWR